MWGFSSIEEQSSAPWRVVQERIFKNPFELWVYCLTFSFYGWYGLYVIYYCKVFLDLAVDVEDGISYSFFLEVIGNLVVDEEIGASILEYILNVYTFYFYIF